MEQFGNVNDVETLKAMLVAQQHQLMQLQTAAAGGATAGSKKRKVSSTTAADEAELLDGSDDDWDPSHDSVYDDAPKKKKASKKGTTTSSKKQKQSTMDAAHNSTADASAKEQANTAKAAAAALKSIKSVINAQMVYKPSLKYGSSRASLELPCLTKAIVATMLGPELMRKATNDKKQVQLKADDDDLRMLYSDNWGVYRKSLRYGAVLALVSGLTFTFNKGTGVLKVHGSFTMMK